MGKNQLWPLSVLYIKINWKCIKDTNVKLKQYGIWKKTLEKNLLNLEVSKNFSDKTQKTKPLKMNELDFLKWKRLALQKTAL